MKSGQFSIEFLIVLGVLLTIVASVTMPLYDSAEYDANQISSLVDAREAGITIARTLNTVYSNGIGSRQTIEYRLPARIIEIRIGENVDGTDTEPVDNHVDVQIFLNWEDDNTIVVHTLLPSTNYANWAGYPLIDSNLENTAGQHRIVVEYKLPDGLHENMWIELKED